MYKSHLFQLFLLCFIIGGCKNDTSSTSLTEKETQPKLSEKTSPEKRHQIYLVAVDNLRVRESAEKSSRVIAKLKERTIAYSEGQISKHTEKITLRSRIYNTPYHKINFSGNTGWCYGGGLFKIYDEEEPDSFTETFESMVTQLSSPNKTMLAKGKHIMSVLRREKSGSSEWNDILFHIAENQLDNMALDEKFYPLLEDRTWTQEEYSSAAERSYDMKSNPFSLEYAQAGLKFTADEGMINLIVDPTAIKNTIEGPFSDAMIEYISIKEEKANTRFFSDAGISSPLSVIVDHTVRIEKFVQRYPHFPRVADLMYDLEYLHYVIINGSDNSPAYDFMSKELNPEWPEAWNQYLKTNQEGMIHDKIIDAQQKANEK